MKISSDTGETAPDITPAANGPRERRERRERYRFDAEWAETENEPTVMSETLVRLRERALKDLQERRPGAVTDWIFLHAQAKGDEAVAHRELRAFESQEELVYVRALSMETSAAQALMMARMPSVNSAALVAYRYRDAVARAVATERVIGLLSRREAPKGAPAPVTRMAPAPGGAKR